MKIAYRGFVLKVETDPIFSHLLLVLFELNASSAKDD